MENKYLVYVVPKEDIRNKEYVLCNIYFITGKLNHTVYYNVNIPITYFKYYFYGSSLEVLVFDNTNTSFILRDITKEDALDFGLTLKSAVTINKSTFDILGTDNFIYNLKQNKLYNTCPKVVDNIYSEMCVLDKFILRLYILKGTLIYVELDDKLYNGVVLQQGFVAKDKVDLNKTYNFISTTASKDKLNQEDIDKIITRLVG